MQHAMLFLILTILHVGIHGLAERFSVLTVAFAIIWSVISLGIYALVSMKFGKTVPASGFSSFLLSGLYFFVYFVFVFPKFVELKIFGYSIVHASMITLSGMIYLLVVSIVEGLVLFISVSFLSYLRGLQSFSQ